MGCCLSRSASDDSPYPPASTQADASSRNITAPTPPHAASSLSSPRGSASQPTPGNRPNLPLKPIDPSHRAKLPKTVASPTVGSYRTQQQQYDHHHHHYVPPFSASASAQWTKHRLDKERVDWWDTRTTGSPEIWNAYRLMVRALQDGEVAEAQALLDATECTCPNGMLWRGIFDNRGEWYKVPEWIVLEPDGLIEDEGHGDEEAKEGEVGSVGEDEDKSVEVGPQLGEEVKIRCRLSSSGRDVGVGIRRGEKVGSLIAKIRDQAGLNPFTPVRIVYGGRIFDDNQPLESHPYWNYDSKHVLVAMVHE